MKFMFFIIYLLMTFLMSLLITLSAHAEKTLTFCAEAPPLTFNSQLATDGATFTASSRTMYNRLVGFEPGTTRLSPSLAKSWSVSPNGKEVTFHLRDDVEFHATDYFKPTRKMTADDVLFSFNRMRDPKHPYHNVGGGDYPSFKAQQMSETIEKIEKVDEHTVKFTLHRPEAPFLANLGMDFTSILSAEYGDKLIKEKKKDKIDSLPIGTGPFVFVWYEKNKSILYKAHDNYFEGRTPIDKLKFLIVTNNEDRLKKMKNGTCQLMQDPAADMLESIRKDPNLKLMQKPGLNIAFLSMNVNFMPYTNVLVRKAINHALDRQKYIEQIYGGNAQLAKNPIPPTMWSYNKRTADLEYNVQKAKQYMKEAGLSAGFDSDIWFADVARPYNPSPKKMAEMIQKDLEVIGIKLTLKELKWDEYLKRARGGELPLSIQGWTGDNGDPDNFLNNLLSCQSIAGGNNRARWCNKQFSFWVDRARVTTDIRKRTKFYEDAQLKFKEEVPWVTLVHSNVFHVANKELTGYHMSPFGVVDFYRMDLKK